MSRIYYDSPIGILELLASEDYLKAIRFVDKGTSLKPEHSNKLLETTVLQIEEYFKGDRKFFDIPFLLEGTKFQKMVWECLRTIPYGETRSYKEVAIKIGKDKAYRAVGNANNKNKLPIIIPCHRVIGINNNLVGYAGGLSRKEWLLSHETL